MGDRYGGRWERGEGRRGGREIVNGGGGRGKWKARRGKEGSKVTEKLDDPKGSWEGDKVPTSMYIHNTYFCINTWCRLSFS